MEFSLCFNGTYLQYGDEGPQITSREHILGSSKSIPFIGGNDQGVTFLFHVQGSFQY